MRAEHPAESDHRASDLMALAYAVLDECRRDGIRSQHDIRLAVGHHAATSRFRFLGVRPNEVAAIVTVVQRRIGA